EQIAVMAKSLGQSKRAEYGGSLPIVGIHLVSPGAVVRGHVVAPAQGRVGSLDPTPIAGIASAAHERIHRFVAATMDESLGRAPETAVISGALAAHLMGDKPVAPRRQQAIAHILQ